METHSRTMVQVSSELISADKYVESSFLLRLLAPHTVIIGSSWNRVCGGKAPYE
jgi:hypothetical protein